jgi:Flp pilus assembly protein TadG
MRYVKTQIFSGKRPGVSLVLFTLVAPALIGMMGLVLDGGLLMFKQRQAQNAADAAALAYAQSLCVGQTSTQAQTSANGFMTGMGLSTTNLAIHNPPSTGYYSSSSNVSNTGNYVEAVVSLTVNTLFIQVLGVNSSQTVTARAVAGFEPVGAGEGVMVLDWTQSSGITASSNNVQLIVNGDITVNANGQGLNQNGQTVGTGTKGAAINVATSDRTPPTIIATRLFSVGGMSNLSNLATYNPTYAGDYNPSNPNPGGWPIFAPSGIAPDPLVSLAPPTTNPVGGGPAVQTTFHRYVGSGVFSTTDKNGNPLTSAQDVKFGTGDTATLPPGIYSSITIQGGSTVTLQNGIYVLRGDQGGGNAGWLTMTGGTMQDNGAGVLFYFTGYDSTANNRYDPVSGAPDSNDANLLPGAPGTTSFGSMSITGSSTVNISPLTTGPFAGMVLYQRRWNTTGVTIGGNSTNINFAGFNGQQPATLYAKWAPFTLAGSGSYNAQFLVGTMTINGGAAVTINATGKNKGKGNLVFLVE